MTKTEIRFLNSDDAKLDLEIREEKKPGSVGSISGYAAVFNSLSEDLGRFREKIALGAFADSLNTDVRALWSHSPDKILGRESNKTLTLSEDALGLRFSLDLPDTQLGRDTLTSIQRRDITGMSFGFTVKEDAWTRGKNGDPHIRTLLKVNLFEISPVAFPAYPSTQVSARDADSLLKEIETQWAYQDLNGGKSIDEVKKQIFRLTIGARFGL